MVFFYPKASTPGCTVEACNLRDNFELLKEKGFELLGVSADSQKRQTNFRNKYNFPFPLLADEDKEVIHAFGVWGRTAGVQKPPWALFRANSDRRRRVGWLRIVRRPTATVE